ncbi:substrate-binding domain-containing protein [Cognatishimia maritima]|uniref:substrate-binding domain-containing protein n=1 Tax=Cognatishimia maritima TaxID=870908 RepID=UPI0009329C7F|nr:substrate-binding domain-containing protein [Cognatishimia maritima]
MQTGRRRIALITPAGFVVHVPAALKEAGLGFIATGQTQPTFDGGATAAKTLLDQHDLDAILCMNDEIALGALTVARDDFRLRVPRDLTVVGYGDSAMAAWPCFGLTTMRVPNAEIAKKTAQLLLERLEHPERSPETIWVTPELIERDTH